MRVLLRLVERARRLPPTALDGSLALALLVEGLLDYRALGPSIYPPGSVVGGPLAIVFLIVEILPIAFRRRAPLTVFLVITLATIVQRPLHIWSDSSVVYAGAIAAYSVIAAYWGRWHIWLVPLASAGLTLWGLDPRVFGWTPFVYNMEIQGLFWIGSAMEGERRLLTRALEERSAQLEDQRDRAVRLAIAEERGRIARELQGVVARAVRMMADLAMEASVALGRDLNDARRSITAIQSSGRQALTEMRRLLGVLRRADRSGSEEGEPPQPLPGGDAGERGSEASAGEATRGAGRWVAPFQNWIGARPWLARPVTVDAALVAFLGIGVAFEFHDPSFPFTPRPLGLEVLLGAFPLVALAFRRRAPFTVLVLISAAVFAQGVLKTQYLTTSYWISLVALYTVSLECDPKLVAVAFLIRSVAFFPEFISLGGGPYALPGVVIDSIFPTFFGIVSRRRRALSRQLEERNVQLVAQRQEQVHVAVQEERARMAREMHDLVAHSVSVMVVQAGAAERVMGRTPPRAKEALAAVERIGGQALEEMEGLLRVLDDGESSAEGPLLPEDRSISSLVREARQAGREVELRGEGHPRALGGGLEISLYRIVQEALTNVRKHTSGARAVVAVRYRPRAIEIEVTNEGDSSEPLALPLPGSGHGLIGMGERVAVFGGELQAGPRPEGGFRIFARLPVDREAELAAAEVGTP